MTDVRVERSETLSRAEAAVWLHALSTALAKGGDVTLPVGGVTVGVHVPDKVRAEFEIEVEGDQVEIELEFSWTDHGRPGLLVAGRRARGAGADGPGLAGLSGGLPDMRFGPQPQQIAPRTCSS